MVEKNDSVISFVINKNIVIELKPKWTEFKDNGDVCVVVEALVKEIERGIFRKKEKIIRTGQLEICRNSVMYRSQWMKGIFDFLKEFLEENHRLGTVLGRSERGG